MKNTLQYIYTFFVLIGAIVTLFFMLENKGNSTQNFALDARSYMYDESSSIINKLPLSAQTSLFQNLLEANNLKNGQGGVNLFQKQRSLEDLIKIEMELLRQVSSTRHRSLQTREISELKSKNKMTIRGSKEPLVIEAK